MGWKIKKLSHELILILNSVYDSKRYKFRKWDFLTYFHPLCLIVIMHAWIIKGYEVCRSISFGHSAQLKKNHQKLLSKSRTPQNTTTRMKNIREWWKTNLRTRTFPFLQSLSKIFFDSELKRIYWRRQQIRNLTQIGVSRFSIEQNSHTKRNQAFTMFKTRNKVLEWKSIKEVTKRSFQILP